MEKYFKENWYRWAPLAGLAVFGFLVLPICVSLAQNSSNPDEAYGEYSDLQERIKKEEEHLKDKYSERRINLRQLNDIDKDILYLDRRIESIEHNLHVKQVQEKNLNNQLAVAAVDMDTALAEFEARLVEWYKIGSQQDVQFLLQAEDLSDFIYRLYYSQIILEEDQAIIEEIRSQKADLFNSRDQLKKEIKAIEILKEDLSESKAGYKVLYGAKQNTLNSLKQDVRAIEDAIDEWERESRDIADFLRGIEGSPFYPVAGKFDGTLSKPIDAPRGSGYGMRRHPILRRRKMHNGQDYPAPTGTPIKAAGGGRVVLSGWKSGYGRTVLIDHGGGLATLYAHCSKLLASDGEFVLEGQVVARVGSTGLSTGPHLHFEVRRSGEPRNPLDFLP